jgi:hypothetical protein
MLALFLLAACTDGDVETEPRACADGFERRPDGSCYEVGGDDTGGPDTAEDTAPTDADGDGYTADEDCDDERADVHPEAAETCDGTDNDCDGGEANASDAATWYADADADGFGDPGTIAAACDQPDGYVSNSDDCNDADINVSPTSGLDLRDGVDSDCDGTVDEDADPCDTAFGSAEWWTDRYEVTGLDGSIVPLQMRGDALVCSVTCDSAWVAPHGTVPDGFTSCESGGDSTMPFHLDADERVCVEVLDPGGDATATCTAHTSAGDVAISLVWRQ